MPGVDKIRLPGELEEETRAKREAEGIYIEDPTWEDIVKVAGEFDVALP